jgi:hypothetical protein
MSVTARAIASSHGRLSEEDATSEIQPAKRFAGQSPAAVDIDRPRAQDKRDAGRAGNTSRRL